MLSDREYQLMTSLREACTIRRNSCARVTVDAVLAGRLNSARRFAHKNRLADAYRELCFESHDEKH